MNNNHTLTWCAVLLSTMQFSAAAYAQLEEVIVTAQKREQNLRDVPLAVSAISAEILAQNAINSVEDLNKLIPSLRFTPGGGEGFTAAPRVRGVGTEVYSIAVESNVNIVIDGVPLARTSLASFDFADVERIEMLRGSQGTLFGKNASAGLLHIITADPSESFESHILANYEVPQDFPGDLLKVQFSSSGPVTDSIGVRLSGYGKKVHGFHNDTARDEVIGDTDQYGLRGKLRWDVSDRLSAKLGVEYQHLEGEPGSIIWANEGVESRNTRSFGNNLNFKESLATVLTVDWELNGFNITAITGYRHADLEDHIGYPGLAGDRVDLRQGADITFKTFTQELRLSSPAEQKLEYTLGALWFDNHTDRFFNRVVSDIPPNQAAAAIPNLPDIGDILGSPVASLAQQQQIDSYVTTKNLGLFAHAIWHFANQWHLTLGARYIDETVTTAFTTFTHLSDETTGTVVDVASSDFTAPRTTIRDRDGIGTLSLQYNWGEHSTVYSTLSTGYRGAAFDVIVGANQDTIDRPVKPEQSRSIEVGIKSRVLDDRLEFELAAFLTRFKDFQAQVKDLSGGAASFEFRLDNAGELETRGVEFEFRAKPSEALFFYGSLLYNEAVFNDFVTQCFVGQQPGEAGGMDVDGNGSCDLQDVAGGVLPNAPKWSGTLSGRYEHVVGDAHILYAQAMGRYQTKVQFSAEQHPLAIQDGYGIVDLRFGWMPGDTVEVAAYVNNVLQQRFVSGLIPLSLRNDRRDLIQIVFPAQDRVFGTSISLRF